MKIIGTAKEELTQPANSRRDTDKPIITPRDIEGIFPASMVDHNPRTLIVANEACFNQYTPAKKLHDSELSNAVDQVLGHFFGDNEMSKRNLLDRKPEPFLKLKTEVTQMNLVALANERGIDMNRSMSRRLQSERTISMDR